MSASAEVFEHETIHVGRALRTSTGPAPRLTQRQFDSLVRFNDVHGGRFFAVGHHRLTATEHVGFVEVDGLALEILPKADRGSDASGATRAWRDGLLEMIAVANGIRLKAPSSAAQQTKRATLLDLVAARFVDEVLILLHQGLAKGYRDEEQNGPTFRGRLLVAEHLRANLTRSDRFYVRTQAYDRDITIHRLLAAALGEVEDTCSSPAVLTRASECRAAFPDVGTIRAEGATFDRLRLGRPTLRYESALTLARMILEQRAPRLRSGGSRVLALLFDMNVLWELYVAALFRRAGAGALLVSTQERHAFWSSSHHRRGVRPDLVVRSRADRSVLLVADTKWKVLGDGAPADADLKQMFVYNELLGAHRAALVYPGGGAGVVRVPGSYQGRAHGCETIHLTPVVEGRWCGAGMRQQVEAIVAALGP